MMFAWQRSLVDSPHAQVSAQAASCGQTGCLQMYSVLFTKQADGANDAGRILLFHRAEALELDVEILEDCQ